jgi:hypothetical protein
VPLFQTQRRRFAGLEERKAGAQQTIAATRGVVGADVALRQADLVSVVCDHVAADALGLGSSKTTEAQYKTSDANRGKDLHLVAFD